MEVQAIRSFINDVNNVIKARVNEQVEKAKAEQLNQLYLRPTENAVKIAALEEELEPYLPK